MTDNLRNIYVSFMPEHLINNRDSAEKFSVEFFSVLSKLHSSFHLKVLETIRILTDRLSLCKQSKCLLELNIISV